MGRGRLQEAPSDGAAASILTKNIADSEVLNDQRLQEAPSDGAASRAHDDVVVRRHCCGRRESLLWSSVTTAVVGRHH
jgi:hypothetical protein